MMRHAWVKAFFSEFCNDIFVELILLSYFNVRNCFDICFPYFEFNNILEAREMHFLSMLETIFYKILLKQIEKVRR
jgi:hypothetical protein